MTVIDVAERRLAEAIAAGAEPAEDTHIKTEAYGRIGRLFTPERLAVNFEITGFDETFIGLDSALHRGLQRMVDRSFYGMSLVEQERLVDVMADLQFVGGITGYDNSDPLTSFAYSQLRGGAVTGGDVVGAVIRRIGQQAGDKGVTTNGLLGSKRIGYAYSLLPIRLLNANLNSHFVDDSSEEEAPAEYTIRSSLVSFTPKHGLVLKRPLLVTKQEKSKLTEPTIGCPFMLNRGNYAALHKTAAFAAVHAGLIKVENSIVVGDEGLEPPTLSV